MKKNHYHVVGVMSGTSLDGIDLAEIFFRYSEDEGWSFKLGEAETIAYPFAWKDRLQEAVSYSEGELTTLNKSYTDYLSEVIRAFLQKHNFQNIDTVCSHGHTILHQPKKGFTLQIGNLAELAKQVQQTVVCDFRVQDVELGGQGAPLVPIGDRFLFDDYDYCLNLGGFANVSTEMDDGRIAYDICPVNIVMNKYAEAMGYDFDDKGNLAKSGELNNSLLENLNSLEFYGEAPPKSLGLEWVQEKIFPILNASKLSHRDILRTFVEHIAMQIAVQFIKDSTVLATGGGVYNDYLISRINLHANINLVIPSEEIIEFKEAVVFGILGVLKLRGEVNCLASVTGASNDHSSGKIFFP